MGTASSAKEPPKVSADHSSPAKLAPLSLLHCEDGPGGELQVKICGAKLSRSFAKVGWMSPYAVVTVDGSEAMRTTAAKRAHRDPEWGASLDLPSTPDNVTVSIWDKNDFHRDVFCGAVTIPCSPEMGRIEMDFELTKRARPTGKLAVILEASQLIGLEPPAIERSVTEQSIGTEMDLLISYVSSRQTTPAASPQRRGAPAVPGSPAHSLNPNPQMPSTPLSLQQGQLSFCFAEAVLEGEGDEEDDGDTGGAEAASGEGDAVVLSFPASDVAPGSAEDTCAVVAAGRALGGPWTCVGTEGLEAFLKATGINVFQRKIACAARWPSWSFSVSDDCVLFVNNTAIGVLREEIPLGRDYTSIDGKGNALASHATWTETKDGGVLLIERSSHLGKYKEERTVAGNAMEFVLTNMDIGCFWGRSFVRG